MTFGIIGGALGVGLGGSLGLGAMGTALAGGAGTLIGSALGGSSGMTGNAQQAADPFASQRPQYQAQLQNLMTNPASFQESPAAQASVKLGMGQLDASMAAKGLGNSGAESAALTQYATDTASKDYYQQLSSLMQMSGAGAGNTGAAAQAASNNNSALGAVGSQIAGGITSAFNSASPTDMTGFQGNNPSPWANYQSGNPTTSLGSGGYGSGDLFLTY